MVEHAHPSEPKGSAKGSGKRSAPSGSERPLLSRYARRAATEPSEPDARETDEAEAATEGTPPARAGAVVGDGVAISPPSPELPRLFEEPQARSEEPQALPDQPQAPPEQPQAFSEQPQAFSEQPQAFSEQPQALPEEPQSPAEPEPQAEQEPPQAVQEPQALSEPRAPSARRPEPAPTASGLPAEAQAAGGRGISRRPTDDGASESSAPTEHETRPQRSPRPGTHAAETGTRPSERPAPGDPLFGREPSDEAVRRVEASEVHDADRDDDRFGRSVLPVPGGRGAEGAAGKKVPFWKRLAMPLVQSATGGPHATPRSPGTRAPSLDPILTRLGALEKQIAANQSATESQLTRFEENLTRLWELEEQMTITEVRERLALLEANQEEIADGLHTVSRNLVLVAVVLAAGLAAGLLALGLLL